MRVHDVLSGSSLKMTVRIGIFLMWIDGGAFGCDVEPGMGLHLVLVGLYKLPAAQRSGLHWRWECVAFDYG